MGDVLADSPGRTTRCQNTRHDMSRLVALWLLAAVAAAEIALDAPHISDLTLLLPPASAGRVEAPLVGYHGCFSWCVRRRLPLPPPCVGN
jgi:hypothetical protein